MRRLQASLIDRVNEWLVALRVWKRQPDVDVARMYAWAENPPQPMHPDPEDHTLRPWCVGASGSRELWRADAVRLSGDINDAAPWVATRIAPNSGPARAAVIFLHGWLANSMHLRFYQRLVSPLIRQDLEVWLPRLPQHMERTGPESWSGVSAISADLVETAQTLRRAVAEARSLASWLRMRGVRHVGLWGVSLGGWVAAIAATVDPGWDAIVLWEPVVDPVATLWRSRLMAPLREPLRRAGVHPEDDRIALDFLVPGDAALLVQRSSVLIIAGHYDDVVPPESVTRLAESWGVGVSWFPRGHINLMSSQQARSMTVNFLSCRLG